jgi:hypothetical protein
MSGATAGDVGCEFGEGFGQRIAIAFDRVGFGCGFDLGGR